MCTFAVHLICFNVKSRMCPSCMHRYTCTHPGTYYLAVQEVGNPRSRFQRAWFLPRPDLRFAVGCLARSSRGLLCSDSLTSSLNTTPSGLDQPGAFVRAGQALHTELHPSILPLTKASGLLDRVPPLGSHNLKFFKALISNLSHTTG